MDRKQTGISWQAAVPAAAALLALVAGIAIIAAPAPLRPAATLVLVALLAILAIFAASQHQRLAQENRTLKKQLLQETDRLRAQTSRLKALNDMAQSLGGSLRLEEVLMQGTERVKAVLEVDAAHIHLLAAEGQMLKLETAVGAPMSFVAEESAIGMGECICGQVASSVQPIVVQDLQADARATRVACKRHGYCTVASVPLRSRTQALGILTVHSRAARVFSQSDLEMMTALGNQLGTAIENAQLYGQMEQRVQELSSQVEHLIVVQERERISREIHDGVAQALALLNMRINVAQSLLIAGQSEQVRKELDDAAQVIDAANRDVREAITALRMTSPKGPAFVPMLNEFVLDFGLRNDIETNFVASDGARAPVLAPMAEVQLMHIVQEALTNVRKHAHARHARVELRRRGARLQVTIEDDGPGFDMDAVLMGQNKKSFGLTTMRERTDGIGGMLDVQTQIGGGTCIRILVPCEPEPAPEMTVPLEEVAY